MTCTASANSVLASCVPPVARTSAYLANPSGPSEGPLRPRPVPCRALRSRNLRHLPVNVRSGPLVCRLLRAPLLVWTTIQNFLTPPLRPLRPRSVPCRALSSFPRQLGRANPWRFHLSRHSRTRSRRPCLDNLGRQGLPLSHTCEPRQFSYNLRSLQFFRSLKYLLGSSRSWRLLQDAAEGSAGTPASTGSFMS